MTTHVRMTHAAVHGLTMTIGDRVVRAKIQAKDEARKTHEAARAAGKTASLLEQHRPNVFEMNLANILPGHVVRVELRYTELLRPEDGTYEFVFPTVVGPRYVGRDADAKVHAETNPAERWTAAPILPPGERNAATFGFHLELAAGMPIAQFTSPSHAVKIDIPQPSRAIVTLDSESAPNGGPNWGRSLPAAVDAGGSPRPQEMPDNPANRDLIIRYQLAGAVVHAGLLVTPPNGAGDGYFLAMIQPPAA